MSTSNMFKVSHVPPTSREFDEIMTGRMNISLELGEFWRQCTDDELEIWFRDPAQWSYVVRAPNGDLVCDGKAHTRQECEEWAIRNAEEYAEENAMIVVRQGVKVPSFSSLEEHLASDFKLDHRWDWSLLGEWRFVLWPPKWRHSALAPLVLQYASARDPLAVTLVQETAEAAVAIVDRLADAAASAISLVGGLAEPLLPWLPPRIRHLVTEPQSDALDGSILMARRAFFRLDSLQLRAG